VRTHTTFGKEPLRLAGVRAFARTEDLHFHGRLSGSEYMCVHGIYMIDTSRPDA